MYIYAAGDVRMPYLTPRPGYDSDYINAVYVDVSGGGAHVYNQHFWCFMAP